MRRRGSVIALMALLGGCHGFGRDISPIRLEPIVTLGATSGEGAIATTPSVGPHHPGGFWIVLPAYSAIGTLPLVFGDDGVFLGGLHGDSTLAGSFSGPMFTRIGPGDSIWVFNNTGRVLVFGPRRTYARSVMLPVVPTDALILADNRVITTQDSGALISLFDANGVSVREIGEIQHHAQGLNPVYPKHTILPVGDGTFWTCTWHPQRQLEHWDTAGRLLRGIDQKDGRFPLQFEPSHLLQARDHAPATQLIPAWIDNNGRLWTVGYVPDQHWQQGLAPEDSVTSGAFRSPISDFDKYDDTTIEVRNLVTGELIASSRFDFMYEMVEPGVLAHAIRTAAGWHQVELMRVVFTEPASRP